MTSGTRDGIHKEGMNGLDGSHDSNLSIPNLDHLSQKEQPKRHLWMDHLSNPKEAVEKALGVLNLGHSRNWVYNDAIRANYRLMLLNDNDATESEEVKKERMGSAMKDLYMKVRNVDDLIQFKTEPEWADITEIRDRYQRAFEKIDKIAEKAKGELKIDIRKAIKPWWCLSVQSQLRKPRPKKSKR